MQRYNTLVALIGSEFEFGQVLGGSLLFGTGNWQVMVRHHMYKDPWLSKIKQLALLECSSSCQIC